MCWWMRLEQIGDESEEPRFADESEEARFAVTVTADVHMRKLRLSLSQSFARLGVPTCLLYLCQGVNQCPRPCECHCCLISDKLSTPRVPQLEQVTKEVEQGTCK